MKKFNPEIGSVITLVTRYKNEYIFSDEKWNDTTYENVTVLSPEKWMKTNQVKISSDTERMPFRIIDLRNIYSVNNERIAPPKLVNIQRVKVAGSKGNEYTVMVEDNIAVSCTCQGFAYRKQCRHLKEVEAEAMA